MNRPEPISTEAEYVNDNGRLCPFCHCDRLMGEADLEVVGTRVYQTVFCDSCDETWTDRYILAGFDRADS